MSVTTIAEGDNHEASYTADGVVEEKLVTHSTDVLNAEGHNIPYAQNKHPGIQVQFYYDSTMLLSQLRNDDGRSNRSFFVNSDPLRSNYSRLPRVRS